MYSKASAPGADGQAGGDGQASSSAGESKPKDDVVEAEFEEVKE
jgi:hypothetical protein